MEFMGLLQGFSNDALIYGGSFLLVLSVLVFIHEWGHYSVARACGVHVESFSIGFGPELFGWDDSAGTRWKFSAIPLGGYVKMYGDTDPASAGHEDAQHIPAKRRHEAFFAKPVAQRAAIVFAGPAINYIYAVIIMALVFAFNGQQVTPPYASAIVGGSAAEEAGFHPYDEVIAIDGRAIDGFEDIKRSVLIGLGEERIYSVLRKGQALDLHVTPGVNEMTDRFGFKSSRGFLGLTSSDYAVALDQVNALDGETLEDSASLEVVRSAVIAKIEAREPFWVGVQSGDRYLIAPPLDAIDLVRSGESLPFSVGDSVQILKLSFIEASVKAVQETWFATTGTLHALGQMIMGTRSAQELGGLIRIGAMAGDVAQRGVVALLLFSAMLSINLGLLNLFPIPVLDGGHLVFYAIEAARGKPVPEKFQDYAFRFGFGVLITLMLFANVNDLVQLFT